MIEELGIILVSHGYFAKYAMESAEMIVGVQQNYRIISVTPERALEDVLDELSDAFNKLKCDKGVVILTDILGGTPSNVAGNLLMKNDNILAFAGFNMPVLLELLLNRHLSLSDVEAKLQEAFYGSLVNINNKLKCSNF